MGVTYWILAAAVLGVCLGNADNTTYEGLRLDISALTFNRDIISSILPGLKKTLQASFPDIDEAGSFFTHLYLTNIKITYYMVNEARLNMETYKYEYPIYTLQGNFEAIYFHIEFEYKQTWIGIPFINGKSTGAVTNVNNQILVLFNESDPDVQIPHPWDVKNLTFSSAIKPEEWALSLLEKHFINRFHKAIDDAMEGFAHELLKTYRYIEDIFPHDIDLVFQNDIMSVKPTVGGYFLSIGFKTNITVNYYIHKKFYRSITGPVAPRGDFDYCLAAQLVPDVLDAVGKGGYYDTEVPPSLLDFETDKVREFFELLPALKERYTGDEEFSIHCQASRTENVNDITQRGQEYPLLQLQNPLYCFYYIPKSGEYFLITDTFMRFYYEMKCKDESFYGHILASEMYDFTTLPILPAGKRATLAKHLDHFASFYQDSELISPGIKVNPNRHKELDFDFAYMGEEEICFHYKEKRPVNHPITYSP